MERPTETDYFVCHREVQWLRLMMFDVDKMPADVCV